MSNVKMSKSLIKKLRKAINDDNTNDAIDWSIVIKHLHESKLFIDIGDFDEPEEDQESIEEETKQETTDTDDTI